MNLLKHCLPLLVLIGLAHAAVASGPNTKDQKLSATTRKNDAEANASIEFVGSLPLCQLKISVKNIGPQSLSLLDFWNGVYYSKITIQNANGDICPFTKAGENAFASFQHGSASYESIGPGKTFSFTIPLEEFFQLKAGKWFLDCKLKVGGNGKDADVQLPQIEFTFPGGRNL